MNDHQRQIRKKEKEARGEAVSPTPERIQSSQGSLDEQNRVNNRLAVSQDQEKRCQSLPTIERNDFSSLDD